MQQHQFKYYVPLVLEKFEDTKGVSKVVNRRTDNTMDKKKRGKEKNNDPQNTMQKIKH